MKRSWIDSKESTSEKTTQPKKKRRIISLENFIFDALYHLTDMINNRTIHHMPDQAKIYMNDIRMFTEKLIGIYQVILGIV